MKNGTLVLACLLNVTFPAMAQDTPIPAASPSAAATVSSQMNPVIEGDSKVALTPGTFDRGNMHASASSYVPLVGIFSGSAVTPLDVPGEFSESKAPANLKRISLTGYSPKAMGIYGSPILCKAKVDDGKRVLKLKNMEVNKDYWKSLADVSKLTQDSDGGWFFDIKKPLERGHYLVTFLKNPMYYWDFDVK
jgi:hypothetical protein